MSKFTIRGVGIRSSGFWDNRSSGFWDNVQGMNDSHENDIFAFPIKTKNFPLLLIYNNKNVNQWFLSSIMCNKETQKNNHQSSSHPSTTLLITTYHYQSIHWFLFLEKIILKKQRQEKADLNIKKAIQKKKKRLFLDVKTSSQVW